MSSLQDILKRAGVIVPHKRLNKLKPHELSLAEKWAVEVLQPGSFPNAKMPTWIKPYR